MPGDNGDDATGRASGDPSSLPLREGATGTVTIVKTSPCCQRDRRVDFRRRPLGPEGVCWSRKGASGLQDAAGQGPVSAPAYDPPSPPGSQGNRRVLIPKMALADSP
jgi:hypothetical protein